MRWWNARSEALDSMLPKSLTLFEGGAGGEGGGGGTATFDPKAVPADWLKAQVQNEIAKATGGKGIDGLLSNNRELLAEKKKLADEYTGLQEKLKPFGDLDEAVSLLKKFGDDEELKLFKDGKLDDLVKKKTDAMVKRHQKDIEDWQGKYAQRDAREQKLLGMLSSATVDRALAEAAAKAGVQKTAIPDVLTRGRGVYRLEETGDGFSVVPKDESGQVIFGKDGKTPQSPDEWVEGLKESAPHLFPGSSGGGSAGGQGKSGSNAIVLPRQHTQAQFEAAYSQAQKEGRELRIAAS